MSHRRTLPAFIVALIFLVGVLPHHATAAPDTATSWTHVTVVATDGARHADVSLAWALGGYLLELTGSDGTVSTLAPLQVRAVLAFDGRDITDEVGAACPADDIDFQLLGEGSRVPFVFGAMIDAGFGGAVGNAEDGGSVTPVGLAGVRIAASERVHLRVGVRRLQQAEGTEVSGVNVEAHATDLLVMVGARLKHPRENDNYSYLEGGLVWTHFDQTFDAMGVITANDATNNPGLTVQGGAVLPLGPRLGVDISGLLMLRPSLITDNDHSLHAGINVALTFRTGGTSR
jgi:hypothetical protein